MAPKTENTRKVAGNARKAESAVQKQAEKDKAGVDVQEASWAQGSKGTSKAEAAAAKSAEAARRKAERDAALKEEEAAQPSKPKGGKSAKAKTGGAAKRGLDLSELDDPSSASAATLNATGIDNALDALSISTSDPAAQRVERHPERRFKAALAVFEEQRLAAMADDKTLRRQQKLDLIRKEFEKHPDNPFNQSSAAYNASNSELSDIKQKEKDSIESRLATNT